MSLQPSRSAGIVIHKGNEHQTQRFPKLRVDANALYTMDPPFYTSAGITAGIDLSLALVEEDIGPTAALTNWKAALQRFAILLGDRVPKAESA